MQSLIRLPDIGIRGLLEVMSMFIVNRALYIDVCFFMVIFPPAANNLRSVSATENAPANDVNQYGVR
jgi:hypothetical protein